MTSLLILEYVAAGTMFLLFNCVLLAYGRPSMIFWAYTSPTPGRALS